MDLEDQIYDEEKYKLYILGSAEVVNVFKGIRMKQSCSKT